MGMKIRDSVAKELVYIGMARRDLRMRVSGRIFHALIKCPPYGPCVLDPKGCQMSNAEKEAIAQEKPLIVSWFALPDEQSARFHEAELLRTYKGKHARLPGIMGRGGKWVCGNKQTPRKKGPFGDLAWAGWHPMEPGTIHCISRVPRVYRIPVA